MKTVLVILLVFSSFYSYSQCVSGDCQNGQGKYMYSNGDKYEGEWKKGYYNGRGTYTCSNGDKYEGEWKNGRYVNAMASQKKLDDKELLGSWQLANPTKKLNQVYNFYTNNIYEIKSVVHYPSILPYLKLDTFIVEIGIFKINPDNSLSLMRRHIPEAYSASPFGENYHYTVSDSTFILAEKLLFDFFKKNESPNKFIRTTLAQSDSGAYDLKLFESDKNSLFLVNSLNPKRKVKLLRSISEPLLYFKENTYDSIKKRRTNMSGLLYYHTDSTVKFIFDNPVSTKNGILEYSENYRPPLTLGTIKIKDINSVEYNTSNRNSWHSVGFITGFISCITILASPLISIDYKNGKFNDRTFLTYSGGGLLGLSVGITISNFNKPRMYVLGAKNQQDKNIWYLDKYSEQR